MDCSLPGSSLHGISQSTILEWIAISSSRGSAQPRDWSHISCGFCIGKQIFWHWATWEDHWWIEINICSEFRLADNFLGCYIDRTFFMVHLLKNPSAMRETWVWSWVGKIPCRRERLPTPVFWPGEFHGLYSPWGCKESNTTEQLSLSHW